MDSRIALQRNMLLKMKSGECYTIVRELGRGGSCIVYEAFYVDNVGERKPVRIKECYPFYCDIKRDEDFGLMIPESEKRIFQECSDKVIEAYKTGSNLFRSKGMTNVTVNTYNIYHANHTIYIVSAYVRGEELKYETYSGVKDSVSIVKTVADTIRKMHNMGYLYLDVKPSNVFTLEGTTELVQLFDFDTMISMTEIGKSRTGFNNKISFTQGFAPVEQQSGDFQRIGQHSDVFGIGALLFYMIFNRTPDVFDCENDAEYDYTKSKLAKGTYQDKLPMKLTEFFHKTLAFYYLDRYSNMETVVEKLSELVDLSDQTTRFVYSSRIVKSECFFGRKRELRWIRSRFCKEGTMFAVSGMGGIGKSTLVRECIRQNEDFFDSIVYLNYDNTIIKTIASDVFFKVNTVSKDKSESVDNYFLRKVNILREISANEKNLLVIDNYVSGSSEELELLRLLNWTIIIITRDHALPVNCEVLEISSLEDKEDVLSLFEENLGRTLTEQEIPQAFYIFESVAYHTLLVEIIAKQIASAVRPLSLSEACELTKQFGFSNLSPDKIQYYKDERIYQDTVKEIVQSLFTACNLSKECRTLLRIIVLFGDNGLEIERLCEFFKINTRDDLSLLYKEGWIYITDTVITTHPVIAEAVFEWTLTEHEKRDILTVLEYLDQKIEKGNEKSVTKIEQEKRKRYMRLAMEFTRGCSRYREIQLSNVYKKVLYRMIQSVSYQSEDYIREKGEEFFDICEEQDLVLLLRVMDRLTGVYYDCGEIDLAKLRIEQIRNMILHHEDPSVQALYYNLLSGYYDELLDGHYEPETEKDAQLVNTRLNILNQAIKCIKRSETPDAEMMLADLYRQKVLIYIRGGLGGKRECQSLLISIWKLLRKNLQTDSQPVRDYYMACAWYYTYVEIDHGKRYGCLEKAFAITNIISTSDQQRIEEYFSPTANILLECRKYDLAERCLVYAITLCEKQLDLVPYQRLRVILMSHLVHVYYAAEEYDLCKTVIGIIENSLSAEDVVENYVPDQIRKEINQTVSGR